MRTTKRIMGIVAICGLAAVAALGLSGCSGMHEAIDAGKQCSSCHEDKQTYDVTNPKGIIETGTTVQVNTSAESVAVCSVTFINENGSNFVPELRRQVKTENGVAEVTLDKGTWALCVIDGTKVSKYTLVRVTDMNANTAISL